MFKVTYEFKTLFGFQKFEEEFNTLDEAVSFRDLKVNNSDYRNIQITEYEILESDPIVLLRSIDNTLKEMLKEMRGDK